jgi:mannosyltransferase OCH1-like enzyme
LEELPPGLKANVDAWRSLNNEQHKLKYFHDTELAGYIEENCFHQDCLEAFRALTSGAGKADFFRILYLWTEGGTWVDSDLAAINITQACTPLAVSDKMALYDYAPENRPRYTIISAAPKHSIVDVTMKRIINNILTAKAKGTLNQGAYVLTGPNNLHRAICQGGFVDSRFCKGGSVGGMLTYQVSHSVSLWA